MKQLVCTTTGAVEVTDVATPKIGAGDLLIEMLACSICGTDIMKVYDATVAKPVQLGHEIVGRVVEGSLKGKRIAVAHHAPDFSSHYATRGSETQDPLFKSSNVDPGGFAELIRVPAQLVPHTVHEVPGDMPTMRAAMMEPLACCLRALDRAPVQAGNSALVIGVGAIGMLFVPLLKHHKVDVITADIRDDRLIAARNWGASEALRVDHDDIASSAKRVSAGRGVDLVILTITNPETLKLALSAVRDGGTIIPFGVKPGMRPELDLWQTYRREINITASYSATPNGLKRAIKLLAQPGFELEKTISHQLPLAEAPRGFNLVHRGEASKVVITSKAG